MARTKKEIVSDETTDQNELQDWLKNRKVATDTRYVCFFDCIKSNPRGDFDNGNRPTVFLKANGAEFGEVTPITLKRCIRDSIINMCEGQPGMEIFIREGNPLGQTVDELPKGNLCKQMIEKFADVRFFGGVVLGSKKEDKEDNEKQRRAQILGPVVVESAETLDPVQVEERTITRCTSQKANEDKTHNIGSYAFIRYARYRFTVSLTGFMAKKTGFSIEDQAILEKALSDLYKYRQSASRPNIRTMAVYKITPKTAEANSMAMDEAMDAIQCKKVGKDGEDISASSYELPEPFENNFVEVTRIK